MRTLTRRQVLTGAAAAPLVVPARALGRGATPPSDRVTLALIGSGGRGVGEGRLYTKSTGCEFVAMCDPREDRRLNAKAVFEKIYGDEKRSGVYRGIEVYADFRDVLRRKDIDAVHIATPDHWHGVPGGQGRLRRKARHALACGRPQHDRGGEEVQAHRATWRATA